MIMFHFDFHINNSYSLNNPPHILGERGGDGHLLTGDRVGECDHSAVQQLMSQTLGVGTVHTVAHKRHTEGGKMHPYLMRSACFKINPHIASAVVLLNHSPVRHGSVSAFAHGTQSLHGVGTVNGRIYGACVLKTAAHNGIIFLADRPRHKGGAMLVQRAYNYARCALVKSAHSAEHCWLALTLQVIDKRVCKGITLVIVCRMTGKKRTFVDDY